MMQMEQILRPLTAEGLIINQFIATAYSLSVGDELTLEVKGKNFIVSYCGDC